MKIARQTFRADLSPVKINDTYLCLNRMGVFKNLSPQVPVRFYQGKIVKIDLYTWQRFSRENPITLIWLSCSKEILHSIFNLFIIFK